MAAATVTPQSWARSLLAGIGAPVTTSNVQAVVGWETAEGGNWHNSARYNPLNTTQPAPGAGNTGSQGNIKAYTSWQQGLTATIQTLRNGNYAGILAALHKGTDPSAVANAIGSSPWGTSGVLVAQTIQGASTAGTGAPITPAQANAAAQKKLTSGGLFGIQIPNPTIPDLNPVDAVKGALNDLFNAIVSRLKYAAIALVLIIGGFVLLGKGVSRATHAEGAAA